MGICVLIYNTCMCAYMCTSQLLPKTHPTMLVLSQGLKLQVFEEKSFFKGGILNFHVFLSIYLSESANIGIEAVKVFK